MPIVRASGCSATTAHHAANVPIAPSTAVNGIVVAANAHVPGHAVGTLLIGLLDAQRDHGDVRGREREHRAERVEVAQQVGFAGQDQHAGEDREEHDREPRRAEARVQAREDARQLAVLGQRPGEPRDADQAGVGGDEQDRRGEHADVVAARCSARSRAGPGARRCRAPGRSRRWCRAPWRSGRRGARPAAPTARRRRCRRTRRARRTARG